MLSRRSFLNNTLRAGLALATAQQAAAQTPAVQPARNRLIVDAQVHLWKAESPDWPWVPGMKPQMPEPFTIEKLVPLMDEAGVDRAVIVPPSWPGDRNDYGIEAAKRYPDRFRVMGRIPLKKPSLSVPRFYPAHSAAVRRLRSAALLLGNRYDQRLRQGHLQAAHHPFHRGAAVPIRAGQRLDHGPRHCRAPWLDLGGKRGPGFRFVPESDRIDTPQQLSESLCNRTCNCQTRSSCGCVSCPATGKEASKQRSRSPLQRLYRHLAELDRALAELQREWSFGMQAAADARGLLAVERDGKVAALGRNLHSAPLATGLGHRVDLGVIDDGAGAVARIGARVVDVALVAGLGAGLFGVFAADEDAAVGIVADPELGIDLEVFVFVLRDQKGGGLGVLLVLATIAPSSIAKLALPSPCQ